MEKFFEGVEITDEQKAILAERLASQINEEQKQTTINIDRAMDGITKEVGKLTGIERNFETEKKSIAYFERFANEYPKTIKEKIKADYETTISDLQTKIDLGFSDEKIKAEIEEYKNKITVLSTSFQETEKGYKQQLNEKDIELSNYKLSTEIRLSTPKFDIKNNNEYEVEAKKKEALRIIQEENNLKLDDSGNLICENKQNYKVELYKDVIATKMQKYLPKQPNGGGANPLNTNTFNTKIQTNGMSDDEKSDLFKTTLRNKGIKEGDSNYGAEMNNLIRQSLGFNL